jgi:hypothetical protein
MILIIIQETRPLPLITKHVGPHTLRHYAEYLIMPSKKQFSRYYRDIGRKNPETTQHN